MRRALLPCCVVIALTGCSDGHQPLRPVVSTPPAPAVARAPADVATLVRAAWTGRDTTAYCGVFTTDYTFAFSGYASLALPWVGRDDEIAVARHLFVSGVGTQLPARSITLAFTPAADGPDPRPGRDPRFHRVLVTGATLRADLGDAIWYVAGEQRFYVVRGDSAAAPDGVASDSTRWWLERWEETSGTPGTALAPGARPLRTEPDSRHTWADLKFLYR